MQRACTGIGPGGWRIAAGASFALAMLAAGAHGGERADLVVDAKGRGHFRTIQAAVDSLAATPRPVLIHVRNGVYNEKVWIRRSNLALVGEDRDSTRIVYAELREEWNGAHAGSDWGSGVVNIDTGVTDVTLANLTVYNNYGWKNQVFNKHQFAVRGAGTRIVLLRCAVLSDGGDALSLWNRENGMYYHSDCTFEGWVDFVCPRGWCYVTHSEFFGHNRPSAAIWHDGSGAKEQKFVIRASRFDGVPGFPLGRNHLDGQVYLLDCSFSKRMADRPFYRPPSSPREWQWGARHYFHHCTRDGGNYAWFADNLEQADGSPRPEQVTARWTFDGRWDPEASLPAVLPDAFLPGDRRDLEGVKTAGTTLRWVPGRNAVRHRVHLGTQDLPPLVREQAEPSFETGRLKAGTLYHWRVDEVTDEGVIPGAVWHFRTAP
jgi:pectinesterase